MYPPKKKKIHTWYNNIPCCCCIFAFMTWLCKGADTRIVSRIFAGLSSDFDLNI